MRFAKFSAYLHHQVLVFVDLDHIVLKILLSKITVKFSSCD